MHFIQVFQPLKFNSPKQSLCGGKVSESVGRFLSTHLTTNFSPFIIKPEHPESRDYCLQFPLLFMKSGSLQSWMHEAACGWRKHPKLRSKLKFMLADVGRNNKNWSRCQMLRLTPWSHQCPWTWLSSHRNQPPAKRSQSSYWCWSPLGFPEKTKYETLESHWMMICRSTGSHVFAWLTTLCREQWIL